MVHLDWADHTDHTDGPHGNWDDYSDDDCYHDDWEDHTDGHSDWDDHSNQPYADWDDHGNTGDPHADWDDGHSDWTDHDDVVHDDWTDAHQNWSDGHLDWTNHDDITHEDWTDAHQNWTDTHSDWTDHDDIIHEDWDDAHGNWSDGHSDWQQHADYTDGAYNDWDDHNDTGDPHSDWTNAHIDIPHEDWTDTHADSGGDPHSDWTNAHIDITHEDWDDHNDTGDPHEDWANSHWDIPHEDWDDAHGDTGDPHSDWDDGHSNWTDEDDDPHLDWTDHSNVAHTDWTDYSDGGVEEGKTWVSVYIDGNDISCYVIGADIWRDALNGIGRWEVVIYNPAHVWGGVFNPDDPVTIRINGVLMMMGYVDDVFPFLDSSGVYKEKMRIKGRDYGMDLAQLYITAEYEFQPIDDIVAAAVIVAGSEITYLSPTALPATTNYKFDRTYLADGFRDLAKQANYDFYIADDLPRTLHFFDVATMGGGAEHTAVVLNSVFGAAANNILRLEIGEELGFGIKNRVEAHAGSLNDHYTELNSTDWTAAAGTTISDNDSTGIVPGPLAPPFIDNRASLLFQNTSGGVATISGELDFSLVATQQNYDYTSLDLREPTTGLFRSLHHMTRNPVKGISFTLEDGGGHIIVFVRSRWMGLVKCFNCTVDISRDEWHDVNYPLGVESGIEAAPFIATSDKGTWYYHPLSPAGDFDWTDVEKIRFESAFTTNNGDYFLIDGLNFPNHEVISVEQDAASIVLYGTRMKQEFRPNIKSQVELNAFTLEEVARYKDATTNVKITAIGETASHYAAQSLMVGAPSSGIALNTQYRIFKLHHQVRRSPADNPITGYDYITEYELVIYDDAVSPTRMAEPHSPTWQQVRLIREQQRYRVLGSGVR